MIWFDPTFADETPPPAPVLFVSGALGGHEEWRWMADCFGPDFRSVALSRPSKIFASLPASAHVITHGTAASIALEIAAMEPWRFRSLTIIDADVAPAIPDFTAARDFDAGRAMRQTAGAFAEEGDAWNAMRTATDFWMGEGAWDRSSASLQTKLAARTGRMMTAYADQEVHKLSAYDLAGIVCPVTFVTGQYAPAELHAVHDVLVRSIPFAQTLVMPGTGSCAHRTDPHQTDPAIRDILVRTDRQWQDAPANFRLAA